MKCEVQLPLELSFRRISKGISRITVSDSLSCLTKSPITLSVLRALSDKLMRRTTIFNLTPAVADLRSVVCSLR